MIERERLLARFALAKEGDYFQVLGVDRKADAADVRRACERFERELGPEMLDPELASELVEEKSQSCDRCWWRRRASWAAMASACATAKPCRAPAARRACGRWSPDRRRGAESMRVVFFGSPEFAVPSLRAVAARHEVVLGDQPARSARRAGRALSRRP